MRIACLGGGPAGLYFAISMKLRDTAHEIDVFERNRADDTFGWGVVFSDQTVENLMANDPVSGAKIRDEFAHWDDIEVHIRGECIRSSGHGFIGIGRKRLLAILQDRARELGVRLHFEHEASPDLADWADYDLVIAADGANSRIRDRYAEHFEVDVQVRRNDEVIIGPVGEIGPRLVLEVEPHAERAGALLQYVQQPLAADADETVPGGTDRLPVDMDVDIVPMGEFVADHRGGDWIVRHQILDRLVGEDDAPAERVVGPVALEQVDFVPRLAQLHRYREVNCLLYTSPSPRDDL